MKKKLNNNPIFALTINFFSQLYGETTLYSRGILEGLPETRSIWKA